MSRAGIDQVQQRISDEFPAPSPHDQEETKAHEDLKRKMKEQSPGGVHRGGAGGETAGSADISSYFTRVSLAEEISA